MGVTNPGFGINGVSAAAGVVTSGTLLFSNSNGISFGINGQTITGTVATNYAGQGFTSTTTAGTEIKATNNSAGLSMAVPAYLTAAAGGGITNVRLSAGTTSNLASEFTFANSNGISFGLNAGTITATVQTNYLTTAMASNRGSDFVQANAVFAGTNASGTIASNGISVSVAAGGPGGGVTLSQWPIYAQGLASSSAYSATTATTAGGTRTAYSLYVCPYPVPFAISYNKINFLLSHATIVGTGSCTNAQMFGLYTNNAGTLSLVSTLHFQLHMSQNSVTARSMHWFWGTNSTSNSSSLGGNVSASLAKLNNVLLDNGGATSLAASHYFLAYMQTHRTSGGLGGGSFSAYHVSESQTTLGSMFGTNVSSKPWSPFIGIVSGTVSSAAANVNIMPSSIHSTAITGTGGSSQNRLNWIAFGSG